MKRSLNAIIPTTDPTGSACLCSASSTPLRLLHGPEHRRCEPISETHSRHPTKDPLRHRRICLYVPLLAGAPGSVAQQRLPAASESGERMISQVVDGYSVAATEIKDPSVGAWVLDRSDPRFYDIIDVYKIARLSAIAEDRQLLVPQQVAEKNTEHTLIRVIERLPRSVNIEHAKRRDPELEVEIDALCSGMHIALRRVLGDPVIGNWAARGVLVDRQRCGVSVDRH